MNTRYRFAQALGGHAVSPPVTVYVHPATRLKYEPASATATRVSLSIRFGLDAEPVRGPVYFYSHYKGERVWRLIGKATERPAGEGRAAASFVAPLDPARAWTMIPCSPTTFAKGSGRPGIPVPHCGTARRVRTVRARLP